MAKNPPPKPATPPPPAATAPTQPAQPPAATTPATPPPEPALGPPTAPAYDPVEAAKVAAAEVPVDDATLHAPGLLHPPVPAPPEEKAPEPEPVKVKPGAPPPDTSKWKRPPVWRVTKGGKAQINRQSHVLAAGKLLDEGSYGREQIDAIRAQGIELVLETGDSDAVVDSIFADMLSVQKRLEALTPEQRRQVEDKLNAEIDRKLREEYQKGDHKP